MFALSLFTADRLCDLIRGAGLVTGHVIGQAVKMSIFRGTNFLDSETQQLSEAFGRAVPIVLAEKIHPTLAETLLQSTFMEPWCLSRIKPILRVFQRNRPRVEIRHNADPETICKIFEDTGAFDGNRRIAFITHGFIHDIDIYWMKDMKNEMLAAEDMVVVMVGWGGGSNIGVDRYDLSCRNIEVVGCWLGNYLRQIKRVKPEIYLWGIGHSLGAHLMGFAGKCSRSFDRITGMDPAGPNFERESGFGCIKLSATDAPLVDNIHTDGYASSMTLQALTAPTNHFGTLIPMGTVDFYPNWGHSQPGCVNFSVVGSHNRAFEYFTESISKPGRFLTNMKIIREPAFMDITEEVEHVGVEVEMGFHCTGGAQGNFFIEVDQEAFSIPYMFGIP